MFRSDNSRRDMDRQTTGSGVRLMVDEILKERMVRNLKAEIGNQWGYGDNDKEVLKKMYLQDLKGACIPDEFIGDDLLAEIRNKYYAFFGAIRDEIEYKIGQFIEIWISPSYDDVTTTLMILDDKLLYKDHTKPWHFWFESEEALINEMYLIYLKLLAKSEKTWDCYTLSELDIQEVAEGKGIVLEGIDLEDVIHYIKKGIEWALDNRDEIIEEAIRQAGKVKQ